MTFEYNKICRLCLNSSNTYLMNIFNSEYQIVEMIAELIALEVFQHDPFPKVICTDCYSNLVIFNEFKKICRNADDLLRKYQINKTDASEAETGQNTKGNGKCKSIRNSDDMAQRIRETAYKKSITFVENMKSFYFLLNQIEDLENGGGQVIIKNEISTESLIPAVELNIKNEIIYPNEESQVLVGTSSGCGVIQQVPESSGESKRKKRKNNKRKATNGQQQQQQHQTMEIDETGNIVTTTRQIVISTDHQHHQQQPHHQNIQISTQNNNEMALMLTVKAVDGQDHAQVITGHPQALQPTQIQIHSNHPLPSLTAHHSASSASSSTVSSSPQTITTILQYSCSSCHEIFNTTDSLRQHLFHAHQILFPFSTNTVTTSGEHQYQQVTLPSQSQIVTTTIQPSTSQQFTTFTHKKYFESEFPCMLCGVVSKNQDDLIKHMIQHTTTTSTQGVATSTIQKVTTIIERDRSSSSSTVDMSATPTDLSSSTTQYK